jgi:hypothetical protein
MGGCGRILAVNRNQAAAGGWMERRAMAGGALLAATFLASSSLASAQELEPRAYSNVPVGLNFLVAGYSYLEGEVATDPALPIENAELSVHGPVLAYSRALDVAGKSARVEVVMPYGVLSGSADVAGQPRFREISGLWDPRLRFSINLFGAPALAVREFAGYRQDWIVGASLQLTLPLGQYDADRVVNLGTNRWTVKPEVGVSKAVGRWIFEGAAGVSFYSDNDEYLEVQTRAQEPVYSIQAHVVYTFPSRIWVAIDSTFYDGGEAELDGVPSRRTVQASRLGATLSVPFNARNSLKLSLASGVAVRTGGDFDIVGVSWQYRWGGGLP